MFLYLRIRLPHALTKPTNYAKEITLSCVKFGITKNLSSRGAQYIHSGDNGFFLFSVKFASPTDATSIETCLRNRYKNITLFDSYEYLSLEALGPMIGLDGSSHVEYDTYLKFAAHFFKSIHNLIISVYPEINLSGNETMYVPQNDGNLREICLEDVSTIDIMSAFTNDISSQPTPSIDLRIEEYADNHPFFKYIESSAGIVRDITVDGVKLYSVVDVISVFCACSTHDASSKWKKLKISVKCDHFTRIIARKIRGYDVYFGDRESMCAVVAELPGEKATHFKQLALYFMQKYYDPDDIFSSKIRERINAVGARSDIDISNNTDDQITSCLTDINPDYMYLYHSEMHRDMNKHLPKLTFKCKACPLDGTSNCNCYNESTISINLVEFNRSRFGNVLEPIFEGMDQPARALHRARQTV